MSTATIAGVAVTLPDDCELHQHAGVYGLRVTLVRGQEYASASLDHLNTLPGRAGMVVPPLVEDLLRRLYTRPVT